MAWVINQAGKKTGFNMIQLFKTKIGWLRIIGFLEGISLLVLVFVAVPMKHVYNNPFLSESLGPVHGALFILFVLYTLSVSFEQNWRFRTTTWKVLASSFLPFGTFYVDYKILKGIK
ncbi:membrane protein [Sunxiuqinia dokdonensis]|uniref:Membrane protein n=2 Tax=Sunxiuqinia dokdonensis TaxID=1409788 RepID=A0A0L8V3C6_9BACT|nr:membrane protein [Sunxiuqinia dokdonensis]